MKKVWWDWKEIGKALIWGFMVSACAFALGWWAKGSGTDSYECKIDPTQITIDGVSLQQAVDVYNQEKEWRKRE
jgi:hypothetical protein